MINSLTINGILGKPAEYKQLANINVLTLSLACSQSEKDKSGKYVYKTIWYKVILFGQQADYWSSQNLDKGDRVLVLGKLCVEEYTDKSSGLNKTALKIEAKNLVQLASTRQKEQGNQSNSFDNDYDDVPF